MGVFSRYVEADVWRVNEQTPLSWIILVSKSLHNRANIITKYQIVFMKEKFFEFNLAIAKETYFSTCLSLQSGCLRLGSHACCLCYEYVFIPTLCLKYNKVLQPYLKHTGSVTKKLNLLKLHFKKFCHTKTVGDRAVLITYLNSAWKST
jgi:hypothetical protein